MRGIGETGRMVVEEGPGVLRATHSSRVTFAGMLFVGGITFILVAVLHHNWDGMSVWLRAFLVGVLVAGLLIVGYRFSGTETIEVERLPIK